MFFLDISDLLNTKSKEKHHDSETKQKMETQSIPRAGHFMDNFPSPKQTRVVFLLGSSGGEPSAL